MNERIRELAEHCDFYIGNEHYDKSHEEQQRLFMEKFAHLIVRECVKVMYDNAIERKVGLEIDKRPTYYAAAILEHFGVDND